LLTALKKELEKSHNERDNLRDEVVPQLRARVEGLEAQAAEHEKLTYENTKQQLSRFNSIDEESATDAQRATTGLTRSNSAAHSSGFSRPNRGTSRPASLIGTSSLKIAESREVLAERVKDVEAQRDALHNALKSLLERQEYQNKENQKRIHQLEMERDRALSNTPRRQGYNQEVSNLREEINMLRRRADEAIEQKWMCEKGLSGIKMDLERAEQEIWSLRDLLEENDISVPNDSRHLNRDRGPSESTTSESLEQAYKALQKSHSESLGRIRKLEMSSSEDSETQEAMARLEQSLSMAVKERDFARQEAEAYRQSAQTLQSHEKEHLSSEMALADELRATSKRVEELATQVRQQLASNSALRQRLAETIERGEKEQKANTSRIMNMQSKLRSLEDALVSAQLSSEEATSKHEEEVRELRESHNLQLLRVKDGLRSTRIFSPKSPLSPMFSGMRSPRLAMTTSGMGISISEQSKVEFLKNRVVELEKALEEADGEMQEVVGKMNMAQIEVMELQNEREEAVRQTKRLEARIEEEKMRGFEKRFASLRS
jgi:chromosome segregation ATPase